MKKKPAGIKFGENVKGYNVPVLNEREIRASAGILFVLIFLSLMFVLFRNDFLLIKYVICIFLIDLLMRVFLSPGFSPFLIIGRLIVSRQAPEYVSAAPKKFAWKIGITVAGIMFFFLIILNTSGIITSIGCFLCLTFLFFESAFGICLGCLIYGWFYKREPQYCAGEICVPQKKHKGQAVSGAQILILLGLIAGIILSIVLFNEQLRETPKSLRVIQAGKLAA